ncbi:MAG: alpha/beta hydrolase [Limisphaerales bacterium]
MNWLLLLVGLPTVLFLFLRWFEHANVYHPTADWWNTGETLGRPHEDVRFRTRDDVDLSAWYFPAATNAPHRDLAVLISHGNGGNISHRLPTYSLLLELGVNVLAYDYRGYGRSEGRPNETGTYLDAEAALEWLQQRGFAPSQVVAFGESLGGGIATELALRHPDLRGLVLQSTFTSLLDLGSELFPFLPVRTIARYHYDNIAKLPRIQVPVLILHSREDTLIPFRHAERNFAAAREPKSLKEIRGDHNDQPTVEPELVTGALRDFLASIGR